MTDLKKPEPTIIDRVNAAAAKVSDVFMEARNAARDELLWLAAQYRELLAERDRLAAALEAAREDVERLDWLDSMNAKLNSHYGTTYRWKLVLSPNVVRLMSGAGGNGHAAAIDLHDSEAHGTFTCREAIDRARKGEQ